MLPTQQSYSKSAMHSKAALPVTHATHNMYSTRNLHRISILQTNGKMRTQAQQNADAAEEYTIRN